MAIAGDDGSPHGSDTFSGPFDFGTRLGLVFIVQTATLSGCAVLGLLSYIVFSSVRLRQHSVRTWSTGTHVHCYFLSLLLSDLIQAIGGVLDARWIAKAGVFKGHYCTAQGILKQLGDVGVALATLCIAIHTFAVLVYRWRPSHSPKLALVILGIIWLFLILLVSISYGTHRRQVYYGVTQYWCWITSDFFAQRIALEYIWLWTSALVQIVLYIPIALVLMNVITVEGWRVRRSSPSDLVAPATGLVGPTKEVQTVAMQMLFYPLIYIITVLPIAVTRFSAFQGKNVPFWATAISGVLFSSSGIFNVVLFAVTRPSLVPQRRQSTTLMLNSRSHNRTNSQSISDHPFGGANNSAIDLEPPDSTTTEKYEDDKSTLHHSSQLQTADLKNHSLDV